MAKPHPIKPSACPPLGYVERVRARGGFRPRWIDAAVLFLLIASTLTLLGLVAFVLWARLAG